MEDEKLPTTGKELLFRVIADGRDHKIYTNGYVEGFGDKVIVANYLDLLMARAYQEREHRQRPDLPSLEVGQNTALPHDSR